MLQTVQFKKQKTKQADVGSSVDLNGYFFSITFHGRNKTAQHEFWHMSNQTHVMLLHFLMASEHWVD